MPVFNPHFCSLSLCRCPIPYPHLGCTLSSFILSLQTHFELASFPQPLETCFMAGLERGHQGHLATGVVIGNKGEETFPRKRSLLGRAMRLMSWQAHLCVPQAPGTDE